MDVDFVSIFVDSPEGNSNLNKQNLAELRPWNEETGISVGWLRDLLPRDCPLKDVYLEYCRCFDFDKWCHVLDPSSYAMTDCTAYREDLLRLSSRYLFRGIPISDASNIPDDLFERLKSILFEKSFIKLAMKSSKVDNKVKPVRSVLDILRSICTSRELNRYLHEEPKLYVISRPWEEHLTNEREFRVFVKDQQVKFVSQQFWFKYLVFPFSKQFLMNAIVNLMSEICPKLSLGPEFVADVWIDGGGGGQLIEINPTSWWGSSGSALFDLTSDMPLWQDSRMYLKYYGEFQDD